MTGFHGRPRWPPHGRSPTPALLVGLFATLGIVALYSWYVSKQIDGLAAITSAVARLLARTTRRRKTGD